MATQEEIFNSTRLDVIVPEDGVDLPNGSNIDDWLGAVIGANPRDKAFFDERLLLYFVVKTPHPGVEPVNTAAPPLELALFLSHLQVTLDAKYIAPQHTPNRHHPSTRGINLALPPRSHSYHNAALGSPGTHPSIFPPHTPHPTPQTGESDRKYAGNSNTEGTILESFVWGEASREDPTGRNFTLRWSNTENVWVAVYRLMVAVAWLRTSVPEPLLSLTVSATLREKPLGMTLGRRALAELVEAIGGIPDVNDQSAAVIINGDKEIEEHEDELHGLEEVNILDGLSQGSVSGNSKAAPLSFPSTRLSTSFRHSAFSLPPVQRNPPKITSPSTATRNSTPVLRKSFLKTLQTVSGFQIRMKSVFVPYVVIPGCIEDEGERYEAGSEERTIVLSVELSNGSSFEGRGSTGFAVEDVDVTVGGEGARANLIGWGEKGFQKSDTIFPLLMGPAEQFNLLYAITFLRQPDVDEVAETLRSEANGDKLPSHAGDKQRPVVIVIQGKPFDFWSTKDTGLGGAETLSYPTQTFRSRWNCVLDLSAGHSETLEDISDPPFTQDVLPAPASPFPAVTSPAAGHALDRSGVMTAPVASHAVAGSKRHTIGGLSERGQRLALATRDRNSTPIFNSSPISSSPLLLPTGRFTTASPTTLAATPRLGSPSIIANRSSPNFGPRTPGLEYPPPTPAYPAYPVEMPPQTPPAQNPISNIHVGGAVGHAIEPRRERMTNSGTPQTPGPRMHGTSFVDRITLDNRRNASDPVVVSVGLVPPRSGLTDVDMIYSLDTFAIEIFVFNRSERTRRFEVSYPSKKRRRWQPVAADAHFMDGKHDTVEQPAPGIIPLENRIRVGPLRPHTCQSVRMQFLALNAGVHSIFSLILTDVESGHSMNLKSVMDVVIHETMEYNV